jgi:hypothetical protein
MSVVYGDYPLEWNCIENILKEIIAYVLRNQMWNYFVETGFTDQTEFILHRCSETSSGLPCNIRISLQSKAVKANRIWESACTVFTPISYAAKNL